MHFVFHWKHESSSEIQLFLSPTPGMTYLLNMDRLLGDHQMEEGGSRASKGPCAEYPNCALLPPRPLSPPLLPLCLQEILSACWAFDLQERPSFTLLMDMLEKLPKLNRRLSHPGHFWKSAE